MSDNYYYSSQITEEASAYRNHKLKNSSKRKDYIGNLDSNGYKHGFGIEQINTGGKYVGIYSHNKKNGWGKLYSNNNDEVYKGFFDDDKMNGFGEYIKGKEVTYYGIWNNNIQNGIGYELWVDSSNYYGEYKNGKKEGKGNMYYENGEYYMGQFVNDLREGRGTLYKQNNRVKHQGEFVKDSYKGKCLIFQFRFFQV